MNFTPLIFSVITPSWNQGKFLRGCIESVLAQGDPGVEHLIFDNCSTDGTARVAAEFPHVKFVSGPDRGQSHAVNMGLAEARGEIICWLNSDDAYPEGVFKRLREIFADPSVEVVFGHARQIFYDGGGEQISEARFERREDLVRWWSGRVRLHQPAIFFRRSVREDVGFLREDLHLTMDYEYWWRMSERHRFHLVPEVLAIQHRQPDSKTVLDWGGIYRERERIFSPFYGMIDQGGRPALMREKRRAMSARYLDESYSAAAGSPLDALCLLARSFRERPAAFFEMRWPGVFRRMAGGRARQKFPDI